jgi:mRNA-degrading endonuclease RelE of RelBE toxin-antitoxin system
MIFIETTLFTKYVQEYFDDEKYSHFQNFLMENPDAGDVIKGTGGLRKIRWSAKGKGKRGGVRIIYYWFSSKQRIYLLTVYGKNEVSDLTAHEKQLLQKIVKEWKNE